MHCKLCGYDFDATDMACHTECPMGKHCTLICCPNCGYQVVDESKSLLARLLQRWWPSAVAEAPPQPLNKVKDTQSGVMVVPLTHISPGKPVEMERLGRNMSAGRLTQLCIFGVVPGETVELLQRRPAPARVETMLRSVANGVKPTCALP